MTELINTLKAFASSSSSAVATTSLGTQFSNFHQPHLMTLGRADSCTESGFNQWRDAMRMVARLPGGLPPEFRIRLWENLADRYLQSHHIEWSRIASKCLCTNSRDQEISDQIDKDLHRTGCAGFSGNAKQAVLKQVLMSYSHWNPAVGYCQGFNMIGAMLLQMTNGNEKLTLKIFIFLIEGVLPEGYFGQGLRGLAVDMAVFREILKFRKPTLNAHLNRLQKRDNSPPLTDVFTMHWFLTLFIHCLPPPTVLRVWDLVLLEGSEILLRTSLVLWAAIETRILCVSNTDEFYSVMGVVTREMLEFGLMDPNSLMKCIVSVGPFPMPNLEELRQRQRALISQDTPCKSFFLAKRELDTLKRHYAAMRHRQRATTIIFKGFDSHPSKGQKSLLVVPTKRQVVSPKPKMRRQISGNNKHNNSSSSPMVPHKPMLPSSKIITHNSINHSINNNNSNRTKQITLGWDKSIKTKFRKRRSSASSHTSTSSSTELCDSSSDEDGVDDASASSFSSSVWIDPKTATTAKETTASTGEPEIRLNEDMKVDNGVQSSNGESMPAKTESSIILPPATPTINNTSEDSEPISHTGNGESELDKDLSRLTDASESSDGSKCIDTNDSQHFLEEMSRLGKSDSFYENMSQRICELQFQNLTLLINCNTSFDKENSLVVEHDYSITSPLPSPISPIQPFCENQDFSKLSLSPFLNHVSPRGSISSNGESPLPRSPLSPSPDPNYSNLLSASPRKGSKSSVSSVEFSTAEGTKEDKISYSAENSPIDPCLLKTSESALSIGNDSLNQNENLLTFTLPKINYISDSDHSEAQIISNTNDSEDKVMPNEGAIESNSLEVVTEKGLEPGTSGMVSVGSDKSLDTTESTQTGQTSEEDINTVIRENIAILQRLKMKPAYGDDIGDDYDYFDYYSTDSSEEEDDEAFRKEKGPETHATSNSAPAKCNSRTRSRSNSNSTSGKSSTKSGKLIKPKKQFNPFPTTRRPRVKSTKFGLYG